MKEEENVWRREDLVDVKCWRTVGMEFMLCCLIRQIRLNEMLINQKAKEKEFQFHKFTHWSWFLCDKLAG